MKHLIFYWLTPLTGVFIGLEIAGVIDWPWYFVLAPVLWPIIGASVFIVAVMAAILFGVPTNRR